MRAFILLSIPLWCLCASTSSANNFGSPGTQCIKLTPVSNDATIPLSVIEQSGVSAKSLYCLAVAEQLDGGKETPVDANIKRVFIFQAADGRSLVRILDLPHGLAHGGF
jgi:hypothetical protein